MNSNNGKPRTIYPPRQPKALEVGIDDIIDYTMLNHDMNVMMTTMIREIQMMATVCLIT
jgi:hypothetical protein